MPGKRIVVVDDDPKVRELIEWTLRPPEFEVISFGDARDALAKLPELRPHLIICDMMMPEMDGRMFLKVVKRSDELKAVPFLFLTAVRVGAEVQAAFEGGAAAFLVKPFPVARLVRTIRDVLEGGPPPAAEPAPAKLAPKAARRSPEKPAARRETERPAEPESAVGSRQLDLDALQEPTDDDFTQMVSGQPAPERAPAPSQPGEEASAPPIERPPVSIEGRFSTVEMEGIRVQVMTEAESRPHFVVTTVVSRDGEGIRRIETAWSHPLKRLEDADIVRRQIDLQHERTLDAIRRGPLEGPQRQTVWERERKKDQPE